MVLALPEALPHEVDMEVGALQLELNSRTLAYDQSLVALDAAAMPGRQCRSQLTVCTVNCTLQCYFTVLSVVTVASLKRVAQGITVWQLH